MMPPAAATAGFHLRLLDDFRLEYRGGQVALSSRKAMALLAYLALQRHRRARRDTAANLLWENVDTAQGRVNLRQIIAAIRRLELPDAALLDADLDTIGLAEGVAVDVDRFDALVDADPDAAVALYRNDVAAGFALRDAPAFNEWLAVVQAHWRQRMVGTLIDIVQGALRRDDDLNAGVTAALRLLAIDPYNEVGHRGLMRLYARQGRSALALSQYRSLADLLRREMGIAPEAETQQLHAALQAGRRMVPEGPAVRSGDADPPATVPVPSPPPECGPGEPESDDAERPDDPRADQARGGGVKRIAVVDDEPDLREAVATYLRLHGFDVVECGGARELDRARAEAAFDLVILDVTMPGEDGFSIARRIDAPIIMLTARTDLVDRVVGLELGADDYIGKPFELRELIARVRAVIRRSA